MMRTNRCPKCEGAMIQGFILDSADSRRSVSSWIEGIPIKSFLTGVKIGKRKQYSIESWRCGRCGFLESYARD
jgi:hypothetical protein